MMKLTKNRAIAICAEGLEDISALEVQELVGVKAQTGEGFVLFDYPDITSLLRLCYKGQSVFKVLHLLCECDAARDIDGLVANVTDTMKNVDLSMVRGATFKVNCKRGYNHVYKSNDVAAKLGKVVLDAVECTVDVVSPQVIVYAYILEKKIYLGIDFAGFDLSKREYKVFNNPADINATLAYGIVRLSGYKPEMTMLDPFSLSSSVAIEAALFGTGMSVHHFRKDLFSFRKMPYLADFDFDGFFAVEDISRSDKLSIFSYDDILANVKASTKNAKIAGVHKYINFSKVPVEWLDTKFEGKSVDVLVSQPPHLSKLKSEKKITKLYQELFYNLKYIMKDSGVVVLLTRNPEVILQYSECFTETDRRVIHRGQQGFTVLTLKKGSV